MASRRACASLKAEVSHSEPNSVHRILCDVTDVPSSDTQTSSPFLRALNARIHCSEHETCSGRGGFAGKALLSCRGTGTPSPCAPRYAEPPSSALAVTGELLEARNLLPGSTGPTDEIMMQSDAVTTTFPSSLNSKMFHVVLELFPSSWNN